MLSTRPRIVTFAAGAAGAWACAGGASINAMAPTTSRARSRFIPPPHVRGETDAHFTIAVTSPPFVLTQHVNHRLGAARWSRLHARSNILFGYQLRRRRS